MLRAVKKWTPEEDDLLLQKVALLSSQGKAKDWTAIASAVPGRSNKDCRKRWCNHLVGGLRKGPWDPSEDRRLAIGVKEYGVQWPLVAEEVGTRSADQCAKRWQHSLDPTLDHSKWTEEEEGPQTTYVTLTRKRKSPSRDGKSQDASSSVGEIDSGYNSADLDLATADAFAVDAHFDFANPDYIFNMDSASSSTTCQLSVLMDLDFPQSNSAEFVLTIKNPSPDTITAIMGVLVSSKTRFRVELK
ncbi:putative myb transcription protein [Neofusicoccum parvum UCRNP2]|uniref:Putative myb transcription protein n=1 Tax=Botryosphaeria parva (strain UCR-NP2) TaxID=1287680 RepID=R1EDW0_BOTPV|nr:putative myb transcription protein [Neofusicoccum parvum UCRNP2]